MKVLLDTHLLLWAANSPDRLSKRARKALEDETNELAYSVVSLWEVALKQALGRPDFTLDPRALRRGLRDNGYIELALTGEHAVHLTALPPLHKDPFDRMLIAQAVVEGLQLLTSDKTIGRYPGVQVL